MKEKIVSVITASVLSLTMLVGCAAKGNSDESSSGAQKQSTAKDKIVYALDTAPTGVFNPLISSTRYDANVNSVVYASLMQVDDKGGLKNYLAEEYSISEDQKIITFKLKSKAKWHDGKPVTAEDMAFTLQSMANGKYTGKNYDDVEKIKGAKAYHEGKSDSIEGIKVKDDTTITIEFEETYAPALTNLSTLGIIPKHIWSQIPIENWEKETKVLNAPIGCGPYKVTKFESGQYVEFEAAEDFFEGKPKTSKLIFKVVNPDTIQAELKSGNIDIAGVKDMRKSDIKALNTEGLKSVEFSDFMFQYMGINLRLPIFQDVRVRQAFMYAINRSLMVDKLLEGRGEVVNAPMLPTLWGYPKASDINDYAFNIDTAKNLLKEAGWEDRNNDGVVENETGEKMHLTLKCPVGSKTREQSAVIIQESLKQIGVEIEILTMEFSTLMEEVVSNHEFDLYMMGNTLSLDPDPKPFWHSSAATDKKGVQGYNIVSYKNDKVDQLIEKGLSTLNQEERQGYYEEIGKILNKDVAQVYLFLQTNEMMYNGKLKGYEPSTFNNFNNVHNWVIE
ncbi:peptide-binding protein [Clostridium amazonitimonense]|uniref:peptide-binding protein n=1 Tax=Clostridium amazonitimonense TaxID=1499689 RepID=UPI0005094D5C|nr:peptide-binding protein [Clostridium amazonitimonense]